MRFIKIKRGKDTVFVTDRPFIENKYHKTSEPFDPYRRMAYHGYEYDKSTGLDDGEIRAGLKKLAEELKDLPHPVLKARAVRYVLENTRIDVGEHDWFVGFWSVNRLAGEVTVSRWYDEVFSALPHVKQMMDDMNDLWSVRIWADFDHVVPDWGAVMRLGFPGLLERAKRYKEEHRLRGTLNAEAEAFFDGIIIQYEAIIDVIDRLYRHALTQRHEKAPRIAACLKSIRDGAPQNIYEAMQVIYIYFTVSECFDSYQVRSLGNGLDATLYPFYRHDTESGVYTREQIAELLRYFLMQWSAFGNYWGQPFYMGGTRADGATKYNELSELILDVYDSMDIFNPKIQLKVNEGTPDSVLNRAFDMIRRGHSSIAFCCEPGLIRAVMSYGASYGEALDMDIRGCYETGVRANEVSTSTGYINAAKALLYVFSNGYDGTLKKQIGPKTGELSELSTFEDFYAALLKQWDNLIEMTVAAAREYEKHLGYINPSNMYSATVEGALEKGRDAYQNGVKFNNSSVLNCGFATLVDSVMAVKEFVYDRGEISLCTLAAALESNWRGYEELQLKILRSPHKYGNNDAEADIYSEALSSYFASKVSSRANARGGVFKPLMHSAMMFEWQGEKTGATPDGRFAWEEMSKNASPSPGMDKNGVTALINSAIATRPYMYKEGHCLDVMLHPSTVSGDAGLAVMKSLLFTYMKNGGSTIQFNVFDTAALRDAQLHPEKYANLQVRICGWNALWNSLDRKAQDAYLKRAENIKVD